MYISMYKEDKQRQVHVHVSGGIDANLSGGIKSIIWEMRDILDYY